MREPVQNILFGQSRSKGIHQEDIFQGCPLLHILLDVERYRNLCIVAGPVTGIVLAVGRRCRLDPGISIRVQEAPKARMVYSKEFLVHFISQSCPDIVQELVHVRHAILDHAAHEEPIGPLLLDSGDQGLAGIGTNHAPVWETHHTIGVVAIKLRVQIDSTAQPPIVVGY